jgi:hypothetical protein
MSMSLVLSGMFPVVPAATLQFVVVDVRLLQNGAP